MSVTSMTGFGHAELLSGSVSIDIEVKSVNNRFLDAIWRFPSGYSRFESELGKIVREYVKRGRIEITISRKDAQAGEAQVEFDEKLFQEYVRAAAAALAPIVGEEEARRHASLEALSKKEIFNIQTSSVDVSEELPFVEQCLRSAMAKLVEMRRAEGKALADDLLTHLAKIDSLVAEISPKCVISVEAFRERLKARLEKLGHEADPARVAQEVAILADRTDVSEEIARLKSHTAQFRSLLGEENSGKRLEFLLQEMGREMNTIGSKSQHQEISQSVVEGKAALEKLREQIQNIE